MGSGGQLAHTPQVAITGRLASMTREQAVVRIREGGGRFVLRPDAETSLLVLGAPLHRGGKPTASLRRARVLAAAGTGLEIIGEGEFLRRFGSPEERETLGRLFTLGQVSRTLGLSQQRIRGWVRQGLMQPCRSDHRLLWFDFEQMTIARSLAGLSAHGVHPKRIRASIRALQRWLPGELGLVRRMERDRHELLVRMEDGGIAEPNGQRRLQFEEGAAAPTVPAGDADEGWFLRGVLAEEAEDWETAEQSYRRSLIEDGDNAEVHFNLGNCLYAQDRLAEALQAWRRSTQLAPDYVEAWNNLGNALAERGKNYEAVAAYRRAITLSPEYADAHFNLGGVLAELGNLEQAREHLRIYLRFDTESEWAEAARQALEEVGAGRS